MLHVPKRLGGGKAISQSHVRSPKQEREIASRIGGQVTKASGAGAFEKGDVRLTGVVRIEAKTTKHGSFRVTSDMLNKIEGFAVQAGEVPAMLIEIEGGARSVYVVPVWVLEGLLSQQDGTQ
jgi:Holliday junction resolvase